MNPLNETEKRTKGIHPKTTNPSIQNETKRFKLSLEGEPNMKTRQRTLKSLIWTDVRPTCFSLRDLPIDGGKRKRGLGGGMGSA